jgi:uncharacterized SAM-binding protein YcdF (DUF218 family)
MGLNKKLGILLLILSFFLLFSGINTETSIITGNVFGDYFQSQHLWGHIVGLIFLIASIGLIAQNKGLEAIMIPTGPTEHAVLQRAKEGIKQYDADSSRLIVISGQFKDKGDKQEDFKNSKPIKIYKEMRKAGIPKGHFIFESDSYNTQQNIIKTLDKLKDENISGITVVTDKRHGRRFEMMFSKAKKKGIISKNLEINIDSNGIENSYGALKSRIAYVKDYLTFGRELSKYSKGD